MIRKSAASIVLAAALMTSATSLIATPAAASSATSEAMAASAPADPTLFKTGDRRVLVMWGDGVAGVTYTVTIAGGSFQRAVTSRGTSAVFENLPLNHRYLASVVAVDSSGQQSAPTFTNTVAIGNPPASEPQATPSASSRPTSSTPASPSTSSSHSTAAAPSRSASPTAPSSPAPPTTPSSTAAPSTPAATAPQPSASVGGVPGSNPAESTLLSQVQPAQWALGALVALLTFGLLQALRLALRRAKRSG